jgi:hypothetical protein
MESAHLRQGKCWFVSKVNSRQTRTSSAGELFLRASTYSMRRAAPGIAKSGDVNPQLSKSANQRGPVHG